jgi:hypothetical protein
MPTLIDLLKQRGHHPRLHPNGFIQLDIEPGVSRLNVWPIEIVSTDARRHPIHNHSYDIKSTILVGALTNITYQKESTREEFATHILHRAQRRPGSANETEIYPVGGELQNVRLYGWNINMYAAGETYDLPRKKLHDSLPQGKTATIMQMGNPDQDYGPLVAVPKGVLPNNGFKRERPDIEWLLWDMIDSVLREVKLPTLEGVF